MIKDRKELDTRNLNVVHVEECVTIRLGENSPNLHEKGLNI